MSTPTPIAVALDGALGRHADGWYWRDGTPEPRVRDMTLRDLAPNFRCARYDGITCVEIPASWRDARHWPGGRIDTHTANAIDALLRDAGTRQPIYADGLADRLDDHRMTLDGWTVDLAQWSAAMCEPCGCWWDSREEQDILAIAARMRESR